MKREIKFRAWMPRKWNPTFQEWHKANKHRTDRTSGTIKQFEKETNQLFIDGFVAGMDYDICISQKGLVMNLEGGWDYQSENEEAVVMQFTGLKDKNGKEIFEGDFDEDMQVVMWCENSVGWQWATYDFPTKEKICCHCYNCEGDYNFTEQIEKVEIHGNIYENAEAATS